MGRECNQLHSSAAPKAVNTANAERDLITCCMGLIAMVLRNAANPEVSRIQNQDPQKQQRPCPAHKAELAYASGIVTAYR
jgi:hypothetical protein